MSAVGEKHLLIIKDNRFNALNLTILLFAIRTNHPVVEDAATILVNIKNLALHILVNNQRTASLK